MGSSEIDTILTQSLFTIIISIVIRDLYLKEMCLNPHCKISSPIKYKFYIQYHRCFAESIYDLHVLYITNTLQKVYMTYRKTITTDTLQKVYMVVTIYSLRQAGWDKS